MRGRGEGAAASGDRDKGLLRLMTCGSVDDGKSTLLGRLLYDLEALGDDQLDALRFDSRKMGTQGGALDFALLADGLTAEREQGITIDVAYRFFWTARRKFIVADAPGHEQFTRNMVTAASTSDLAVVLVDARKGVLTQTRRHSFLAHLLGIRSFVLAVNKMDLVGFDQKRFRDVVDEYAEFAKRTGIGDFASIPLSSLHGDNLASPSAAMPWFRGRSLIEHLESVEIDPRRAADRSFRMPVQWVNRPHMDFRGLAGTIAAGTIRLGDPIQILPSGTNSAIKRIVTLDGDLDAATAGDAVTLTLADEVECARGDVLSSVDDPPELADQFQATIIWLSDAAMLPGRACWLKLATQTVSASVQPPRYRIDVDTGEHLAAETLAINEIGVANLATDRPLVFEPYQTSRELGGFILIDKITNATIAAGMLNFALRRSQNVHPQALDIGRADRALLKNQKPRALWLTGISGAGKSTIANLVEQRLVAMGRHTFLLDGDNLRHGLSRDLGFTDADRVENIRRAGEVARLMADAGLIVIAAFISPFRAERQLVRDMLEAGEFVEVHIDTPIADAEARDVKGLYRKARSGELANFTGIDSPYEAPVDPEIHIDTTRMTASQAAELIVGRLLD